MNWKLFALGSAFFAGLTAILAKIGVEDVPSNLATLIRVLVLLPLLAALVFWRGEWRPVSSIPTRTLVFLTLSGIATGLSWLCYYRALQLGPASVVAPIDKASVLIAVLLGVLLLGERPPAGEWLGIGLIAVGTIITVLK
jgi:transporter family protein